MPARKYPWDEITEEYRIGKRLTELKRKYGFKVNTQLYFCLRKRGIKTHGTGGRLPTPIPNSNYKKLTKEKAYLLAVLSCGDGCVQVPTKKVGGMIILQAKDREFLNEFIRCIKEVYGFDCVIQHPNSLYPNVKLCSNLVVEDLLTIIPLNKEPNWYVPKIIKEGSKEIKISYLKGFTDSQGTVYVKRQVRLYSKNIMGLEGIQKLLEDMGIEGRIRPVGHPYYVSITGYCDFKKFYSLIGFVQPRKQKIAELALNNINKNPNDRRIIFSRKLHEREKD